jgi:3-deoxy-D-manno-octulosonate 8-phosphate phosphatase (KDO 8-P phosphatase)
VAYLREAAGWLGPIREENIIQTGEAVASVRHPFKLLEKIPAQRALRGQYVAAFWKCAVKESDLVDVREIARKVRLLVLDVDGVLTDGGMYMDSSGGVVNRFHIHDGLGFKLAQAAGLELAVISGLKNPVAERRVKGLGVENYFDGHLFKAPVLAELCAKLKLEYSQVAYMGDDWVDGPVLAQVGLPMAVANAQPQILAQARWVATLPGGQGAVRQAIMFILDAWGKTEELWQAWSRPGF